MKTTNRMTTLSKKDICTCRKKGEDMLVTSTRNKVKDVDSEIRKLWNTGKFSIEEIAERTFQGKREVYVSEYIDGQGMKSSFQPSPRYLSFISYIRRVVQQCQ